MRQRKREKMAGLELTFVTFSVNYLFEYFVFAIERTRTANWYALIFIRNRLNWIIRACLNDFLCSPQHSVNRDTGDWVLFRVLFFLLWHLSTCIYTYTMLCIHTLATQLMRIRSKFVWLLFILCDAAEWERMKKKWYSYFSRVNLFIKNRIRCCNACTSICALRRVELLDKHKMRLVIAVRIKVRRILITSKVKLRREREIFSG